MNPDYYKNLPKKRMGSGALFLNDEGEVLIVKPNYKDHWSIPGGVVNKDESPRAACIREVKEEIGLVIENPKLLCVDYFNDHREKGESLQFIFYGGILSKDQIGNIKISQDELEEYKLLGAKEALLLLGANWARRLPRCLEALKSNTAVYSENGK